MDFLHVGDFKTGTTWMQNNAFNAHPEIVYLGDPPTDEIYLKLFHQIIDSRDIDFNANKLSSSYSSYIKKKNREKRIVGVSREVLSATDIVRGDNARRNAERLKAVFGDVKIIFIIREQFSMLASIYSQYIKMGGTLSIKDFILDPFECRGILERLKYHKTLAMYTEIFGVNNVYFDLFERFKMNKREFLKRIYTFIGCKNTEFFPPEDKTIINKSLTTGGVTFARFCNHFVRSYHHNRAGNLIPIDKIIATFLSEEKKAKLIQRTEQTIIPSYGVLDAKYRLLFAVNSVLLGKIRQASEKITIGQKIKVPEEIRKNLEDQFKESNTILLQRYNLPVDQYGWTL